MRKLLTEQLVAKGIAAPELPDPPPFYADPPLKLDLTGFGYGHSYRRIPPRLRPLDAVPGF